MIMRTRRWIGLGLCLAAALAVGPLVGVGEVPARPQEPKAKGDETPRPGEGKRAQEFIAAFNRGDAKAVASFWTADGDYIDQSGRKYKGRAALEKLYEKVFAANKGAKLTIHVSSLKQLAPDVVLEEGTNEVTPADGGPPTAGAFSAVAVKKDGEWYFQSVRETIVHPPSNAEHFDDLEWLIGEWTGDTDKAQSGTASFSWSDNRNFMVCSFALTLKGIPVVGGTQWIAWDAVDKQIRSYSFYSNGGIGEAVWTKGDGNQWSIKVAAKTADGKKVSVTNILTRVDADHATWQPTQLTVDGKAVPDTELVKFKRVKEEKR
jgi:uncharacterized protein (TIGR02246 family)